MSSISIGIPTYNSGNYIQATLESVLSQTFSDLELIVSDDASTDQTPRLVMAMLDPRLRMDISSRRLGLVGNWNRCLSLASSPYVCVFNHDDLMLPDNLARKVAMLDAHPRVGFVFSNVDQIDSNGQVIGGHWSPDALPGQDTIWPGIDFFRALLVRGNIVPGSSVVMRRSLLSQVGGFDSRVYFTLDLEMWLRLALQGDVGYVAAPLVRLRRHAHQVTGQYLGNGREVEQSWRALQIVFGEHRAEIPEAETMYRLALSHLLQWALMLGRRALRESRLGAVARYSAMLMGLYRARQAGLSGLRPVTAL
jgi:glycosyltransferase involved in cell wall biosynthesis